MKICPKCSLSKAASEFHNNKRNQDGLSSWCKLCNKQRYADNQERLNEENKARYWADPERARRIQAERRNPIVHREGERERALRYKNRSFQEIAADRARLRPNGKKKCRKCLNEKVFEDYGTNSRLADGLHSECKLCRQLTPNRLQRIARFKSRGIYLACSYCGGPYEHIDHVWPVALGGLDVAENLLPSCSACNFKKSSKNPWLWLRSIMPRQNPVEWLDAHQIDWTQWQSQ